MKLKEFLQSEIGQYFTALLHNGYNMEQIIEYFQEPILEIEEMLAISLSTHCTQEEIEKYVESNILYECTPHGKYLESCIQYAKDNVDLIISNHKSKE